ncbi:glycerol-3-phosphate dehydrogenase [Algicella marina]|uniref:Glycerol-3-phosphate dehydrogenase n=1 Tax=Algicella marina TaxID=2683284 RepID=A0A6P1T0K9_9RHOB|nr:glycerol-3-phosphate dehydrogenase [Algicella marina]QHQ35271.1 glycerol-3-phosphate dehydrogenase [Algicella marina]
MDEPVDIFIIGGGINGCGIARDAAGRNFIVALAEKDDLAQATSSASTKLFHGGLRYLEYYEFRLVREALRERETLLQAMPHISWPLRFVLPHHSGLRPAWLLRLGLFIYDHLGGRKFLPATKTLNLRKAVVGRPLKDEFSKAFEYSDCWVNDARLVVLNARDAAERGAKIMTRTEVMSAKRAGEVWEISLTDRITGESFTVRSRCLVNAGGPWVGSIIEKQLELETTESVRLVRGSHIVTRKLFNHDRAYIFQGKDGRIVFAIPYEDDFTLIGTTDVDHEGDPADARCSPEEALYLCESASEYFTKPIASTDVVWSYSGVRPLYNDNAKSATAATREYVLSLDTNGPVVLNVFGGKITTYRKLAEAALAKLSPHLDRPSEEWTAGVALPGGDFPVDGFDDQVSRLQERFEFISEAHCRRLVRAYGTDAGRLLEGCSGPGDLGMVFGADLTEREVEWLRSQEFAITADDIVWRRSKLGLCMSVADMAALSQWLGENEVSRQRPY